MREMSTPGSEPPELPETSPFARQLSRRQLIRLDCALAIGYLLFAYTFLAGPSNRTELAVPDAAIFGLVAAMGMPLAVRRIWPLPVFAVVLAATICSLFITAPHDSFGAAGLALYTVALTAPQRSWLPTGVIAAVTAVGMLGAVSAGNGGARLDLSIAETTDLPQRLAGAIALGVVVLGATWTLGCAVRDRRAMAARSARQLAHRLVAEERLHIARELHDVVAHSMSLIAVKAGVANHVARKHPEEAFEALRVIEDSSKNALTEMRQLLGVLRSDGDGMPQLAPMPGLAELSTLIDGAAKAGVRVDTRITGVTELPAGLDLTAYRILQEAVTNVVKHAAPAHCRITVDDDGRRLLIEVTDDGSGARTLPGNPAGHGLTGMAERVAVYSGEFSAGPRPGGGFAVSAVIPYRNGSDGIDRDSRDDTHETPDASRVAAAQTSGGEQ